ncbi:MAG TPA: ABC transporter substrate-binding protein [Candidatus Fusicatenibacter intestinigallinarum]|uniref:ABC transporter substrate-binding protein n=1 Tax=Candidatus Fusicatenibacter intestinigallinarum TaxID=2838598 RepID=A0A9D2SKY5_9FIRM|nr:ABC transporter substrate-binding protein [Candidatus Fusicatenibacter intestinigallinarum]
MKRKMISLVLCAAMAMSALAGCSSGDSGSSTSSGSDTGSSKYEDFITVDVFDGQANYQGTQSGWFAQLVKEKFNMELNIIAPNVAGGGDTLFQTRSAAGDLGDLILTNADGGRLQNLVTAGLVMDMTDLLADAENVHRYDTAIESTNSLVEEDGIYAIPSEVSSNAPTEAGESLEPTFGPYVRWDAYKAIGYPEIKDLDGLLDVMKQMQEAVPTSDSGKPTYAMSFFKDWDGNMMNNAKQPTCYYGYDELGFVLAKADGSDYQDITDSDSIYMDVLEFFYKANQMGLVDPESTTQNYDTMYSKYQDGQILFSFWPWLGQAAYNTTEHKAEGKGFMLADIDNMQIFSYGCIPNGNAKNCIMIGSKAEDPQRLADFIDWLYSPEGIMASASQTGSTAGPEGLTWEMQDGQPVLTEFGQEALNGNDPTVPDEWGGGSWSDGVSQLNYTAVNKKDINPDNGFTYDYTLWDSVLSQNNSALDLDWQEHMGAQTTMEYLENNNKIIVAPGSGFAAPEEDSQITTLRGQCRTTIVDTSWQMIFASNDEEFQSLQKQMQDTLEGLDYQTVLDYDMDLAHQQNDARVAIVEQYAEESGSDATASSSSAATDSSSAASSSSAAE